MSKSKKVDQSSVPTPPNQNMGDEVREETKESTSEPKGNKSPEAKKTASK